MKRPLALSLLAALLLSGCRLDLVLRASVAPDGVTDLEFSVTADRDVIADINLDDIDLTGVDSPSWHRVGPVATDDDGARLTLSRQVVSPDLIAAVVDDIDDGRLFSVDESDIVTNIGRTDYVLEVSAIPSMSAIDFTDDELTELFDGEPFGIALDELEEAAGGPLDDVIFVAVEVVGPDGTTDRAEVPLSAIDAVSARIDTALVDSTVDERRATSAEAAEDLDRAWRNVMIAWGAAALLLIGVVVALKRRRQNVAPTI